MAKKNSATFDSLNPVNGDVVGTYPIASEKDVYAAVTLASDAAARWVGLGFKGRRKVLMAYSRLILSEIDSLATQVTLETGKPHSDAKLEITLAAHHVAWAARNAEQVLRTSHRSPGALMANMSATVERSPLGVVGIIGPWNYPVFTPMGSIAYALAAGNTVVFKPSEYTPGVGVALADLFEHVAGSSEYFQVVTGYGETGAALCTSGVKKLAFTGSTATAKKVAALCAQTLTPVIAECGGKDPVIIARDADLALAADATIWSAFSNAGQTCIGAERVYVDENVADIFTEKVIALAKTIHAGNPESAQYGPATMPSQLKVIESHIKDAVKRGGIPVVGGTQSVGKRFVEPVVLLQVPEDSTAVTEETFGPTLVINRVPDMETAIALSNASRYGLGASVWSRRQGRWIASQLHCGMVAINSVISFAGVASIPFGGTKDSGYGRIHGPEGLLEFTYPRSVVRAKFQLPLPITSFKRTPKVDNLVVKLLTLLRGRFS
jgi:acyl-CoA reductase-like NAD-dependent aldehyde dehydrogenase